MIQVFLLVDLVVHPVLLAIQSIQTYAAVASEVLIFTPSQANASLALAIAYLATTTALAQNVHLVSLSPTAYVSTVLMIASTALILASASIVAKDSHWSAILMEVSPAEVAQCIVHNAIVLISLNAQLVVRVPL